MNNRGKLLTSGNGRDTGYEGKFYVAIVIAGIVILISILVMINAASEYRIRLTPGYRQTMRGIALGDNGFLPTWFAQTLAVAFIAFVVGFGIFLLKFVFDSEIAVYEEYVRGTSLRKESFELKYSEISSVSTQYERKWESVNINASGQIFKVYTSKANEIVTIISKLRESNKAGQAQKSENPAVSQITTKEPKQDDPLLRRAFLSLEDGEWDKADELCEQILNSEPENAKAYVGKLLASLQVKRQEDLLSLEIPLSDNNNYRRALQFADQKLKNELELYALSPDERNSEDVKRANEEIALKESGVIELLSKIETAKGARDYAEIREKLGVLALDSEVAAQKLTELATVTIEPDSDLIICKLCKEKQMKSRATCYKCGLKFNLVEM